MKTKVLKLTLALFIFLPMLSMGQSYMQKLYDKFAGEEGFTSVNISSQMFKSFANIQASDGENTEGIKKSISNLDGLLILNYEPEGRPKIDFMKEVEKVIPMDEFNELMTISKEDTQVRFLTHEEDGEIVEMIMIANDGGSEYTIISFTGIIDLQEISKISRGLKIDGLEGLDQLEDKD